METLRIDQLLVEKKLAPSRERAQSLVLAGVVYVGTQKVVKSSEKYALDSEISVQGEDHPYVSRGGVKLAGALDHFQILVQDKICLDIGASTGGFTDCLLQRGACRVYALDVGYGQLAWKLRQDSRVVTIEKKNIRDLSRGELPLHFDLIVIDVSFISLKKVFPTIFKLFDPPFEILALIKPQFEVGKSEVPRGGVVKDAALHERVMREVQECALLEGKQRNFDLVCRGIAPSSLPGTEGNQEYFINLKGG